MEYFIKAIPDVVKAHPEARFVIAGSGEDEEKLKALSKEVGAADYLTFLGYRTDVQKFDESVGSSGFEFLMGRLALNIN